MITLVYLLLFPAIPEYD